MKGRIFGYVVAIIIGAVITKYIPHIDVSASLEKVGVCDFSDYIEQ